MSQLTQKRRNFEEDVLSHWPGPVAQSDAFSTGHQEVAVSILWSGTILSWRLIMAYLFYGHSLPSADSRREVVSYVRKCALATG